MQTEPIGKVFGSWTVVGPYEAEVSGKPGARGKHGRVLVRCSCGFEEPKRISSLRSGRTHSCRRCILKRRRHEAFSRRRHVRPLRIEHVIPWDGAPAKPLVRLPIAELRDPGDHFWCEPYRATVPARACLMRQRLHGSAIRYGDWNRVGIGERDRVPMGKGARMLDYGKCKDCPLGREVAAHFEGAR